MKNKRLRNSLIAAGIAVATGVVLFGVNAAIGDAPGYTPPGSGVSPVFSALEVTGILEVDGNINANADIDAVGNIFTDGYLDAYEGIITNGVNGSFSFNGDGGDLIIKGEGPWPPPQMSFDGATGSFWVDGDGKYLSFDGATGDFDVDGDITTTTGSLTVGGNARIDGDLWDNNSAVTVNDSLNVTGNVYDSGGNFTIDDTLNVTGSLYDSGGHFTIDDTLNVMGNVYDSNSNFTIDDALNVTGNVYDSNSYFTIDDSLNVTGNIYDSNSYFTIGDTVEVNGHLKADSIGSFYTWSGTSGYTNSWGSVNQYCDSNHVLLGCWGGWLDITDSNKQWVTAIQHATTPTNRYGCYLNGQNNTGSSKRLRIWVSCFNPNG